METAFLKLHNDTPLKMDNGKVTARSLFDLTAVFDTINNTILVVRLTLWYEVSHVALSWLKSYVSVSKQRVNIGVRVSSSSPRNMSCCLSRVKYLNVLYYKFHIPLS